MVNPARHRAGDPAGLSPTADWRAGADVRDRIEIGLPDDLPPDDAARLRLLVDDRALMIDGPGVHPAATDLMIGAFRIHPPAF